jgi:hypothetical protein
MSSSSGVPASRSASVARAFAIAASILPRWRTMPASRAAARRRARRSVRPLGVEAGEALPERLALAQDRDPGEPGLEALET